MKWRFFLTAAALLALATMGTSWALPEAIAGPSGLVIKIFIAYLVLIAVSLLYSALAALRQALDDLVEDKERLKPTPFIRRS